MTVKPANKIAFIQDLDDCIRVLKSAGQWRKEHDILYSPIWDPDLISHEAYLAEFFDYQAYVLYLDDEPIATATLADPAHSKLETWKEKLGEHYFSPTSLYVDDLAVVGPKIGQWIIELLIDEIEQYARANGYTSLRLDIDSRLNKLRQSYARCGFVDVLVQDVGTRTSLFMEKTFS